MNPIITASYNPSVNQKIFVDALWDCPELKMKALTLFAGVKVSGKLPILTIADVLKNPDANCLSVDGGTATFSEKEVTICEVEVNMPICKRKAAALYENNGIFAQIPGANNDDLPPAAKEAIMRTVAEKVKEALSILIWRAGGSGYPAEEQAIADLCDNGFLKQFAVPGSGVVQSPIGILDETTIVQVLQSLITQLPTSQRKPTNRKNLYFYCSAEIQDYILFAASVQNANQPGVEVITNPTTGEQTITVFGIKMLFTNGLPTKNIVLTSYENLVFATDMATDFENIMLKDLSKTTKENIYQIQGLMRLGMVFYKGENIVWGS